MKHYFIEEIKRNQLMSKKLKKACTAAKYIEYLLTLPSSVNGRVSTSAFKRFFQ